MSKKKLEGKNTNNNVLTSKGLKVFKRRNKVKAALVTTSAITGVGAGLGIGYAIFHQNQQQPTPTPPITQSYISAYAVGILQINKEASPTYIKIDSNNDIEFPSSGELNSEQLVGLPIGVHGEWSADNKILLKGIPSEQNEPNNYSVTINFNDLSTSLSITVLDANVPIPEPIPYIKAYCDDSLQVGEDIAIDIIIKTFNVTIPPVGVDANIVGLPDNVIGKWNIDGNITLSGIPNKAGTYPITIYVNEVSTTTTLIVIDTIYSYSISPVNYQATNSSEQIHWTATQYKNGKVNEVISGDEKLTDDYENKIVTFTNGLEYDFNVHWNHYTNYIILNDNREVTITNPEGLMKLGSTSSSRLSNTTYTSASISDVSLIKEFHIKIYNPFLDTVSDNYGSNLCYYMSNLEVADIRMPEYIKTVGTNFCSYMFDHCSKLHTVIGLNLSQTITTVGNYFCFSMFQSCTSLVNLPTNFTLPQSISYVMNAFCQSMFTGCTSLMDLPVNFNLPQSTSQTEIGANYCYAMFNGCEALKSLPNQFTIPQSVSKVGSSFCYQMFQGCKSLSLDNSNLNLPQQLTNEPGQGFCQSMFRDCINISTLSNDFNLPQLITTIGNNFCDTMFYGCTNLTVLPNNFNLPQLITTIGNSFCSTMFHSCSNLATLPIEFNYPKSISSIGTYFCSSMFYNCSSLNGLGTSGDKNLQLPSTLADSDTTANNMFDGATILTTAGVPPSPTITQLKTGYNIARNNP